MNFGNAVEGQENSFTKSFRCRRGGYYSTNKCWIGGELLSLPPNWKSLAQGTKPTGKLMPGDVFLKRLVSLFSFRGFFTNSYLKRRENRII